MNGKIEKRIGKKDKKKRLCLSILVLIMLLLVPVSAYASETKSGGNTTQAIEEENKTVRVGYFPYANFQEGGKSPEAAFACVLRPVFVLLP